eukprot:scaffold28153_cov22-Cyclotella_meneghiniana.AAC.1
MAMDGKGNVSDDGDVAMFDQQPSGQPGAFEALYNIQDCLPAKLKLAYIVMMKVDKDNRKRLLEHQESASTSAPTFFSPDQYVTEAEPFVSFLAGGKGICSLVLAKEHNVSELQRRISTIKSNAKNKTVPKLMELLAQNLIIDQDDLDFIEVEHFRMTIVIQNKLDQDDLEKMQINTAGPTRWFA